MISKFLQWLGRGKDRRKLVGVQIDAQLRSGLEIEVYEIATGRVVSRTPVTNLSPGGLTSVDIPAGCWFCFRNHIATGPVTATISAWLA